jgi:hypothetical protein
VGFDGWLRDGEEVRWSGKPARGMPLDRTDVLGMVLLVLVVTFTAVWQTVTTFSHEFMQVSGTLVWVLLFGAVLAALVRRRSSSASYVVTNRRLLVQTPDGIDGIPLSDLAAPTVFGESRDGVGNISFGPPDRLKQALTALVHGADTPNKHMHLMQIDNAREVAGVLRSVIRG